jgi:osmotically-inducible protein OsmY
MAAGGAGAAAGAAGADPDRNTGNVITDSYLTGAVKSALAAAKGVRASDINVDTRKGVVTLNGTVRSSAEATQAVEVARSVAGVKGVKSKLRVGGA